MTLDAYNAATNIIASLPDRPVTDGGLSVPAFKAKFDLNAENIVDYLNTSLKTQLEAFLNTALTTAAFDSQTKRVIYIQDHEPQNGDDDGIYLVYEADEE